MSPQPPSQPITSLAPEAQAPLVIPIIEETASITRELVETGRVRLTKTVTERTETIPVDLRHDQVRVEHVPINQFLPDDAPAPDSRYEGDTLVIPVLREVLVKRLLLVEELRVTRQQTVRQEPQTVVLRHEEVREERLPPAASPGSPSV